MVLPILFIALVGFVTGVSATTNLPAVEKFGEKYLCETCAPE